MSKKFFCDSQCDIKSGYYENCNVLRLGFDQLGIGNTGKL